MKKICILVFLLSLTCKISLAQKENNVWYFGLNAGLNFNSGSPVAITNGALNTSEGCSSISDANGAILFYTDGSTIWNKNNVAMPNGTGLTGNWTSTQSALIVKQPGNSNLYYVFTTYTTLNYSIVDMTLDGGLGDVTASKNVFMINSGEQLCATKDSSGTNVWIVMHETYSNGFNAYLLTASGINLTPVHSNDGMTTDDNPGQMKISIDGSRIAMGTYDAAGTIYLGHFNNATGGVSGGFSITTSYDQTYGLEFSPDGSKLYGGANSQIFQVYQFDLNAGSPAAIIASSTLIGSTVSYEPGALQLGPDNKIYISPSGSSYLDAIDTPNAAGTACSFVHNAVYLGGKPCDLGLPSCVFNNFAVPIPPVAGFQSNYSTICADNCINFTNLSTNATSWQWTFAGAEDSTSTSQNPQNVCYTTAGTYNVTLIASNTRGRDSVTLTNYITVKAAPSSPVIIQNQDTLYFSTDSSYLSCQWYMDSTLIGGATDTFLVITVGGNYNVEVLNKNGCQISVGINVIIGIRNYAGDNFISLYPNPATTLLTVQTPSAILQNATLSIINTLGQVCRQSDPARAGKNPKSEIDVSSLPAGMYFLQLKSESGSVVRKFVKE